MDDLFNKIYSTEFLFEVFSGLDEGAIKDYYALFISSMAYYKFIKLEKIDEFLINKSINNIENELNNVIA